LGLLRIKILDKYDTICHFPVEIVVSKCRKWYVHGVVVGIVEIKLESEIP
jgi:hypothetical protein